MAIPFSGITVFEQRINPLTPRYHRFVEQLG